MKEPDSRVMVAMPPDWHEEAKRRAKEMGLPVSAWARLRLTTDLVPPLCVPNSSEPRPSGQ